jgi:4-hydroxy-tetrahydrodipicolinate synthase
MSKHPFVPLGIFPACLLPFNEDFSIDEPSLRAHLRDLVSTVGVKGIVLNAHASEVASCTFDEQRRVLEVAQDEVGDMCPIVHGVYAEDSAQAVRIARMADEGGASALLVFPPSAFALGVRADMAIAHFRSVAEASDLPIVVFQYPVAGHQGYTLDTLDKLCAAVPSIRAIKDWCSEPQRHEQQLRMLRQRHPDVAVLTAHSAWLLGSLALGCPGVISGAGSVIAALQAAMFDAVGRGDLEQARRVSNRMFPLSEVFYSDPWVDMHNRMKEALVLLGKLRSATVRPPLVKLPSSEIERVRQGLIAAGMLHA